MINVTASAGTPEYSLQFASETLIRQGDDLGSASSDRDLWLRVGQRMRVVEDAIRVEQVFSETQRVQQQIVDDLNTLIDLLEQQSASGSTSAQRNPGQEKRPSEIAGENAAKSKQAAGPGKASEGSKKSADEDEARRTGLLIDVWGQLPEQLQQQIQSPVRERFLPAYEPLIIDYYERLAEGDER